MEYLEGSRNLDDYLRVKDEASKPLRDRRKIIKTNRGTYQKPRRYHLLDRQLQKILRKMEQTGQFVNPFRRGGAYWGFIQALIDLGVDQAHCFCVVKRKMRELLSSCESNSENAWNKFISKDGKNILCALDANGRIEQNAAMLQRLTGFHPYGEKLRQLGACIDILSGKYCVPLYRLRTGITNYMDVIPINEFKKMSPEEAIDFVEKEK